MSEADHKEEEPLHQYMRTLCYVSSAIDTVVSAIGLDEIAVRLHNDIVPTHDLYTFKRREVFR